MNSKELADLMYRPLKTGLYSDKAYRLLSLLNPDTDTYDMKGNKMRGICMFYEHKKHPDSRAVIGKELLELFQKTASVARAEDGETVFMMKKFTVEKRPPVEDEVRMVKFYASSTFGVICGDLRDRRRVKEDTRISIYFKDYKLDTSLHEMMCLFALISPSADGVHQEVKKQCSRSTIGELVGLSDANALKTEPVRVAKAALVDLIERSKRKIFDDVVSCWRRSLKKVHAREVQTVVEFKNEFVGIAKQLADEETAELAVETIVERILDLE